jgi:hypothetical protein
MKQLAICAVITAALMSSNLSTSAQAPAPAAKKSPFLKLAEPWPDAETIAGRRTQAENRPLFKTHDPLSLVLTGDFKMLAKERNEKSPKRFDATLAVGSDPAAQGIPVKLGTRGHVRLRQTTCAFPPIRVEFAADAVKGTLFEGQKNLKLVTHCRDVDDFEQYILQEHAIYRIFNLVTPHSFRARLAKMTYVDSASRKPVATRFGMFLEDDDDVARRSDWRTIDIPNAMFKDLDQDSLTLMMLFEFMVGNTDMSIMKLHNVRLMQDQARKLHPVPYDFDYSGIIETRYAVPAKQLGIVSVRDRLYRGPCRTEGDLEPLLERFRGKKAEILALYDSIPDLKESNRKQARQYLEEFYNIIERKDRVKKLLVDDCNKKVGGI